MNKHLDTTGSNGSKSHAVEWLSTTAVILFVGLIVIVTRPDPAAGSGMTARRGAYIMTVGSDPTGDEELLYLINSGAERMIIYRFNSARDEIVIVKGEELSKLRDDAKKPGPAKKKRSRGRRP